jgi:hypothetical protein
LAQESRSAISPEVEKLIRQLDADDFADRTSASEQLAKLGQEAVPALEAGVSSASPETAMRSFALLQELFEKGNEAAKSAAKAALERLAKGDGRVSLQAKNLLTPPQPPADPNQAGIVAGIGIARGRILLGRGGLARVAIPVEMAPRAIAAAEVHVARSISTSIGPDGVKTINVDDNGKKIRIVDDPKKGIEGEYTETKDGKETTQKFAAKDADELKTKHPEAHKLYLQFAKGEVVRAEAIAVAGLGPRAAAAVAPKEMLEGLLKKIEDQIAATTKELAVAKEEMDPRLAVITRRLESYNRLRDRYQEQLKLVEDQAAKAAKAAEDVRELKIQVEVKAAAEETK